MNTVTRLLFVMFVVTGTAQVIAQESNIHERHMERAHPTPNLDGKVEFNYMLPFETEQGTFPSVFLNANMIIEETDQLPAQNESSIAVNPNNPKNIIGSAVDYRANSSTWAYYTTNGGKLWQNVTLGQARTGWASSNDPSVCYNRKNMGFLCYGAFNRQSQAQFGENGIFVSRTSDGGATWNPKHIPVILHLGQQTADSAFEDKYYIHVDTASSSPYLNRLYIPWKRVINADSSTQIVMVYSTDDGITWSKPVAVGERFSRTSEDTTFGQSFPLIRTGPDGTVYCIWNSGTERAVRYNSSTDGGVTWGSPRIIQRYAKFGVQSTIANQTNSRVKGMVRAETYPTLVVDNTGGERNGWLYLCYCGDKIPNVYFSSSTDKGTTWSDAKVVHSDTTNDQFWPWIALDPTSGEVAVMYFDSRDDAANILVNTYVSLSLDGGTTWVDKRVGDGQNDLRNNPFGGQTFAGDYSGCDFYGGFVYPSWVDMRNTTEGALADNDVYTAVCNTKAPAAPSRFIARTIPTNLTAINLEWSAIVSRSFGQPLSTSEFSYRLKRDGALIATVAGTDSTYLDTGLTNYQRYTYTLEAFSQSDTSAARTAQAFAGGSRQPGTPLLVDARGAENNDVTVTTTLPNRRLDGATPLVNLAGVRVYLSEDSLDVVVAATDTGATLPIVVRAKEQGWYRVAVATLDANGNVGEQSDTTWIYTGSLQPSLQDYSKPVRYLSKRGSWGTTTNFAFSEPASYSDSPIGAYANQRRDTVLLFPVVIRSATGTGILQLSARVAAFVAALDSVFIEASTNGENGNYTRVAWYNETLFKRWEDTAKGDDAWQVAQLQIPFSAELDTMYLRLTMRSNASKVSDGFYIDDLQTSVLSSIQELPQAVTTLYPNPAKSHVVLGLQHSIPITMLRVFSATGINVTPAWEQNNHTVTISVANLESGVYTVQFVCGEYQGTARFVVFR